MNFDTAIRETFSVQAAVCRDSSGKIVKAISQINPPCDPTFGEALAARLAASLVASLQLKFFSLEGDSKIVIAALTTPSITIYWHIDTVIANALALLTAASLWEVKKNSPKCKLLRPSCGVLGRGTSLLGLHSHLLPPPPSSPICSGKDPPPSLLLNCCKAFGSLVG